MENDQNVQKRKHNADSIPKYQAKAHTNEEFGLSTDVAVVQAHLGTDHAKAIARWAHQGVGAPWVRPYPHRLLSAPSFYGGCMLPCYGGSRVLAIFQR